MCNGQRRFLFEQSKVLTLQHLTEITPSKTHPGQQIVFPPILPRLHDQKLTIPIAEDDGSNFKLFKIILQRDYNLIPAWNSREAVELFQQKHPHLVLMDINMPVMNGYEAAKIIRTQSPTVPVIAVTAYAFAEDEQRILKHGFDAYASKPIKSVSLKKLIIDWVKKRMTIM